MSFWVFLDYQLETTIVIFGISTLKFAEIQKNVENLKKKKKIRTKYTLFGHQFEKVLSYFQQPLICHLDFFDQYNKFWQRIRVFYRSGARFFFRSTFSEGALYKV